MTSEYEHEANGNNRGDYLIGGIYRVVKSIDEKMDSFLEEMREWVETRDENAWYDREERSFYE
ncbi:MAG: hypothetical protein KC964_29840 [Candidatus Omnitrophica bacterium]|nr:hypothetical protein [Candidatus Omnitrophota bacterium]